MASTKLERELAHVIFWQDKDRAANTQREYDEECREAAEQGFRPHYCIHGTNLWTDYDPICGYCENGEPLWDDARDWDNAKHKAAALYAEVAKRSEAALEVVKLDHKMFETMIKWCHEPLEPYGVL